MQSSKDKKTPPSARYILTAFGDTYISVISL